MSLENNMKNTYRIFLPKIKIAILILLSGFILMSCDAETKDRPAECSWYEEVDGEFKLIKKEECEKKPIHKVINHYQIIDGSYYFENRFTSNYSCGSFKYCDAQYATYYKITDDLTLRVLEYNYSKDQSSAYYHGLKIVGSDPNTFEIINEIYSKDKDHLFFKNKQITNADLASFEMIESDYHSYSKDKNHVYFKDKIIEEADPDSFIVQQNRPYNTLWNYDKNHFFYINKKIPLLDTKKTREVITSPRNTTLYTDDQNIVLATYIRHPRNNPNYPDTKEKCSSSSIFEQDCIHNYEEYENLISQQDIVIYPDIDNNQNDDILGIKYLNNIAFPIQNFTDLSFTDGDKNLVYFDLEDRLIFDDRFKGQTIKRLPLIYDISSPHQININREASEKSQKYGGIEFFEDDESIYFMAVTNYSKEVHQIGKILQKNDLPIYNLRIDSNNQYIIQGNQLYRVNFDTYLEKGEEPLKILSLEIDGILKGVFKGHSADLKFVDDSGIIDARTLTRTFPKNEFGTLRLSNKTNSKGIIFENDHYFFLLYHDIEDNRRDSSFQIHKEDVTVHYLSGWGGDLSRSINIEFLEYLGLDVQKVKDRANQ
ncbi:DKNYY domain-containing protein [Ignatzschineria sp. LJL83]